ncbi:MAG: DNA internalization-related competence protein ComEC/Rec2 [Ignavibacteria bacterium]|nr:DNA internalization-related competence protein ComEC/Rec2 [Ignavibacteria bacterium]
MNIFSNMPALKYVLILISGILFQRFSGVDLPLAAATVFLLLILIIIIVFTITGKAVILKDSLTVLLIFFTGIMKAQIDFNSGKDSGIRYFPDTKKGSNIILTGIVSGIPDIDRSGIRFTLESKTISARGDKVSVSGKVIVSVYRDIYSKKEEELPVINPGDEISVKGRLSEPAGRRNPGDFNYKEYLELRDVYKLFYSSGFKNVKVLSGGNLGFIEQSVIFPAKMFALKNIDTHLTGDNAAYLKGLVTGERSDISEETKEAFINAGVMHLIAVSGLNVTYVILSVSIILSIMRIPFRQRIFITCIFLIFYCMFTGSPASIVRATLMGILVLMSFIIERKIFFYNIISVSAICIILYDARILFDTGFILSYSATLSMVIIYSRFEEKFLSSLYSDTSKFSRLIKWAAVLFFTTLAAQIGTLPLTALYFGKISVISLITNMAAVPLANISLAMGFLQILSDIISSGISSAVAEANNILLSIQLAFIKYSADPEFSFFYVKQLNIFAVAAYYFICGMILFSKSFKALLRNLILSVLISAVIILIYPDPVNKLIITFLDVGQGDCALIETPCGKNILVDCGNSTETFDNGEKTIAPLLRRKGISKIDIIILTHMHQDHIGGVNYLLKHFEVKSIIESGQKHKTKFTAQTDSLAYANKVSRVTVRSGDIIDDITDMRVYFLFPTKERAEASAHPKFGNLNNGSVTFILKYKDADILFTGDIEGEGELFIRDNYSEFLKTDVLKVAHHGSVTSTTIPFTIKNSPEAAVISCGKFNKFSHPSEIVLNRLKKTGAEVFRTDNDGAVILETDGHEINITNIK